MAETAQVRNPKILGRYALFDEIAAGGMATIHLGRLLGTGGFSRTVAIKRLHPHLAKDPDFRGPFLDEARLAARIRHPNVVQTLDVVALEGELFLVMEYVHGEPLSHLLRALAKTKQRLPFKVVGQIIADALNGLHAAHEATDDQGKPLGIVHRDISPQNVLVCTDGVARVLDFGIAKAAGRLHTTRDGQIKGKLAYMAPEQVNGGQLTRQVDVFATAIVLWESLTGRRLFRGASDAEVLFDILTDDALAPPSSVAPELPTALDHVVLRGLQRDPSKRFATAHDMALALEAACGVIPRRQISEWVNRISQHQLDERSKVVAAIESISSDLLSDPGVPTERAPVRTTPAPISAGEGTPLSSEISTPARRPQKSRRWLAPAAIIVALGAAGVLLAARADKQSPRTAAQAAPLADSAPVAPPVSAQPKPRVETPIVTTAVPGATPSAAPSAAPASRPARPATGAPRVRRDEKPADSLYSRH
jgi:eukaryotic-like serine/threonine-protein kinase